MITRALPYLRLRLVLCAIVLSISVWAGMYVVMSVGSTQADWRGGQYADRIHR